MKKHFITLLLLTTLCQSQAQDFDASSKNFKEVFGFLCKSAGNAFTEVKGPPIISNMFGEPDTIGYRIKLLPQGVTDWKHISGSNSEEQTLFFKLGEYSTDSAAVAKRLEAVLALIKEIDSTASLQYDDSYSDTKIKEVYICSGGGPCGEEAAWRVHLYFHRFADNEFNVSVNMRAYPALK